MTMHLKAHEAKKLAKDIVENGSVDITGHAWIDLEENDMSAGDVLNILCGGAYDEAEFENRQWRHRARTQKYAVIVAFLDESSCMVVTGFSLINKGVRK